MTENNNEEKNRALDKPRQYSLTSPQQLYHPPESVEEEVHLRDYINVIIRRKWILITFLVAVVTTVTIGTFMMSPQYKSIITIKIEKENPNILAFKDVMGLERAEEDYYQTQYKVIKSRNLAKRVIRSLRLYSHPEFIQDRNEKETGDVVPALARQDNPLTDKNISSGLIDSFLKKVDVSPLQKSRLVNVSFISYDPELSANVANAIGESFIQLNIESKFEATYQARTWLDKQLDIMKAKVEQAEERLNEYAAKNEIIFLKEDDRGKGSDTENIITRRLSELSTNLTAAISDRIGKEALYREISSGDPHSSSVVMNNPLIMGLKKTYAELQSEYYKQLKIYKPDYPNLVKLQEQINQIEKKMDLETKKIVSSVKKDYQVAVKRENQLKLLVDAQKQEALSLNQRTIQYQILKREADTNKELYNGLLQRLKETGVSASLTASNIQILDKAEVPKTPCKPRKTLNIMLSVIVGLFGGVGLAFFTEYLDNTIKTPEDIEKRVYMPQLGLVPYYDKDRDNFVEHAAHSDSGSPIAEAYRSIRTFLLLSTGGKPPRMIMVTSPSREEGKTTTAINTAVSLTKSDVKVVLVDADMRRSKLHDIFSFDNVTGLSTFLSGNMEFKDGIIKTSYIKNLDVITSGPIPPNPAELLSSYRFQDLLHALYSLYNFIIIDTPPVIGISDPLIVSPGVDGVIMVVRSGKTAREAAHEARRLLHGVNARILGVVLNAIDRSSMRYSYYYNYYKHYYTDENK
ncbi:MAG: polysaccharide biosynthesis tyrosine autokinase [Nitrospirae bacterium]|jgi:polysaccharide biosynthesis transport protein|nr:polysaccharide biosynthesis tyrosine autokinase [Nitrospirota bacterium]